MRVEAQWRREGIIDIDLQSTRDMFEELYYYYRMTEARLPAGSADTSEDLQMLGQTFEFYRRRLRIRAAREGVPLLTERERITETSWPRKVDPK